VIRVGRGGEGEGVGGVVWKGRRSGFCVRMFWFHLMDCVYVLVAMFIILFTQASFYILWPIVY